MKKERLESFQNLEVGPSPGLWKKIEAELPAKKRHRWFLILIFSGIIISAAGIKYFMEDNSSAIISHAENKKQVAPHLEMRSETVQVVNNLINRNNINDESVIVTTSNSKKSSKAGSENSFTSIKDNSPKKNPETAFHTKNPKSEFSKFYNSSNSDSEIINKLDAIKYTSADENDQGEIISRELITPSKKKLTRWIIYACAAYTKSSFKPYIDTTNEFTQTIEGISDFTFGGGIRYDVNNRIRISLGFTLVTRGQVRSGLNNIVLKGVPLDPGNTYTINTGIGNISGLGTNFDHTFFNSTDSILFPVTAQVIASHDTVKSRYFTLKEEFKYVEFPLMISFRANEKFITPYAGIILSTGYLYDHSIKLDDKNLDYDYQEKLSKFIFSAGFSAGFDIRIYRSLSFFLNGFYEKNLNSVITGDSQWKPYVMGAGAGINYRISMK